jgi:hypothetical protein
MRVWVCVRAHAYVTAVRMCGGCAHEGRGCVLGAAAIACVRANKRAAASTPALAALPQPLLCQYSAQAPGPSLRRSLRPHSLPSSPPAGPNRGPPPKPAHLGARAEAGPLHHEGDGHADEHADERGVRVYCRAVQGLGHSAKGGGGGGRQVTQAQGERHQGAQMWARLRHWLHRDCRAGRLRAGPQSSPLQPGPGKQPDALRQPPPAGSRQGALTPCPRRRGSQR